MKILYGQKDGGAESRVRMWGIEVKSLFSVLLMKFEKGSRDAFHTHAFNSISWLLTGGLREVLDDRVNWYFPAVKPIHTYRNTHHKVIGLTPSNWVLSLRGPWVDEWFDITPERAVVLTHGRQEVRRL